MSEFSGKRILVTGSTDGIGLSTVIRLTALGAHVFVHGRDPGRVREAAAKVPRSQSLVADLSSLAAVRRLVEDLETWPRLDLLINNAGVGMGPPGSARRISPDGFELLWAVNFLAPFALTEWLIAGGAAPRAIVNVASAGQEPLDFEDPQTTLGYSGVLAYRRSKLALIAWTLDVAARHPALRINAVHPGTYLASKMVREAGITPLGTVGSGADAVLGVARMTLNGETRGAYFDRTREARAHDQAYDLHTRERLRRLAEDQVRQAIAA